MGKAQQGSAAKWVRSLQGVALDALVFDIPPKENSSSLRSAFAAIGLKPFAIDISPAAFGDAVTTPRTIMIGTRHAAEHAPELAGPGSGPARFMGWQEPLGKAPPAAWEGQGQFTRELIPRRGPLENTEPMGHWHPAGQPNARGAIVFNPGARVPTPHTNAWVKGHPSPLLLLDGPGPNGEVVRRITPVEAWRLQGGQTGPWRQLVANGEVEDELARDALPAPRQG